MKKTKIAILGATSHIAKGLISVFLQRGDFDLHLYARSSEKISDFLTGLKKKSNDNFTIHDDYGNFLKIHYDVIINCVGVGTLKKIQGDYTRYFMVTEKYDNLVIQNLCDVNPDTLYISFSSGAIYGSDFSAPFKENTINGLKINHIDPNNYYAISRLNAESKHRSFKDLNIVDLRIFSYFSRFADLEDGYFITELINAVSEKKVFKTDDTNIVRDYISPKDLFSMILKCIETKKINSAFDVFSAKPVEKKEILDYFSAEFNLKYEVDNTLSYTGATGAKNIYYSTYDKAMKIGYKPEFSSLDVIKQESNYILNKKVYG
ncbi:MAG: NAD(P)-dependent oxidoreductase [bacterium]